MAWSAGKESNWRGRLQGHRILVVEDDGIIMLDLVAMLEGAGAEIVGPCSNVDSALDVLSRESCDAAVLDLRLSRGTAAPVAEALDETGTPFLFYTGQSPNEPSLRKWADRPIVEKPVQAPVLVSEILDLLHR